MTIPLFRQNAYLREASGTVTQITSEGGIILDQTVFFPKSGGQPGDSGVLIWEARTQSLLDLGMLECFCQHWLHLV